MTTNSSKTVGFCLEGEKMFKKVPDQRQLGMKEHAIFLEQKTRNESRQRNQK